MTTSASRRPAIPLAAKLVLTAFIAVMVPVYWVSYGPTNFLYFCDVALLLTFVGIWLESPLLISMCCVGILIPQLYWLVDFTSRAWGFPRTEMTAYIFRPSISLFARSLSFFHGWLPLVLLWLVFRLGYDRRGFLAWGLVASVLVAVAYLFLPHPGMAPSRPNAPVNIDYVTGFSETTPQHWLDPRLYVVCYLAALWLALYLPTHLLLKRLVKPASSSAA